MGWLDPAVGGVRGCECACARAREERGPREREGGEGGARRVGGRSANRAARASVKGARAAGAQTGREGRLSLIHI